MKLEKALRIVEENGYYIYNSLGEDTNFDYIDNLLLKDIYDKFEASNTFERQALRDKILKL